jgi:mono/diheme cytochrome c family protein
MLCAAMKPRLFLSLLVVPAALLASGCGEESIKVAKSDPLHQGAEIFNQRCGGCHTFDSAGTEGSSSNINSSERKDGPNFNQRLEPYEDVIYAIENGGFSSGPMPQNIVTGHEAQLVACFVATYSGQDAKQEPSPGDSEKPAGAGKDDCRQQVASAP